MEVMADRDVTAGFLRHIRPSVMKSAPHPEMLFLHILGHQIKGKTKTKGFETEK